MQVNCEQLERHGPPTVQAHCCWPLLTRPQVRKLSLEYPHPSLPVHPRWVHPTGLGGHCEQKDGGDVLTDPLGRLDPPSGP